MKVAVTSKAFAKNAQLVSEIESLFTECRFNRTGRLLEGEELFQFLDGCDAAIVAMEEIKAPVLDNLPDLKVIAKFGVGLNNIDQHYCQQRGVAVRWTAGVNRHSVAEMALCFMLMLMRNLYVTSNQLKSGTWNKSGGVSLGGKTIGIVGLGHIGKTLVDYLAPFGCEILANDIVPQPEYCKRHGISQVSFEQLITSSDVVTAHVPLTDETRGMFNASVFEKMNKRAIFLNTARGDIVDYEALKRALSLGEISGAAIDVYDAEPPTDSALLGIPNLICTPHIGGNSVEATLAMGRCAIEHLRAYLQGCEDD